jgi:outer membrane immunogenic protein
MRRVLLTTASLLAFAATAAVAADLPRAAPARAPAVYAPVVYNWTGFYLGINGGYGWGRSHWDAFDNRTDFSGGMVGGTIGYNWQALGSPWVFGLEGDGDWTNLKSDTFFTLACPGGCQTKNSWLATARGRVGYAWDRVMPYLTGGLAIGDIEVNQFPFASVNETKAGWTVGGGIEAALGGNWTAKVEYLHVDLGSVNCDVTACGVPSRVGFRSEVVRGGVNFRF